MMSRQRTPEEQAQDEMEIAQNEAVILQDETYGPDEAERSRRLQLANRFSLWFIFVSLCLSVSSLILAPLDIGDLIGGLCSIFAIIMLISYRYFGGLMRFTGGRNSGYANIGITILYPILTLIFCLLNTHILDYMMIWIYGAVIMVVVTLIFFLDPKKIYKMEDSPLNIMLGFVIMGFLYGASLAIFANRYFDTSVASVHKTAIVSRHISHGKADLYHITINPIGVRHFHDYLEISEKLFEATKSDDSVSITMKSGWLGTQWYTVTH